MVKLEHKCHFYLIITHCYIGLLWRTSSAAVDPLAIRHAVLWPSPDRWSTASSPHFDVRPISWVPKTYCHLMVDNNNKSNNRYQINFDITSQIQINCNLTLSQIHPMIYPIYHLVINWFEYDLKCQSLCWTAVCQKVNTYTVNTRKQ